MGKTVKTERSSEKRRRREEHVIRWKESGLTKAEYCRQNGIHPNVLTRWITKYAEKEERGHFVKVKTPLQRSEFKSEIEVTLPSGIRIRMEADIHPIAMREIVNAIKVL
jgi:transposase-like protein